MRLLQQLKSLFTKEPTPILSDQQAQALDDAITELVQPRGQVVRANKRPEYKPMDVRRGGRMVKTMPRELRHIKEAQEKVEELPNE